MSSRDPEPSTTSYKARSSLNKFATKLQSALQDRPANTAPLVPHICPTHACPTPLRRLLQTNIFFLLCWTNLELYVLLQRRGELMPTIDV